MYKCNMHRADNVCSCEVLAQYEECAYEGEFHIADARGGDPVELIVVFEFRTSIEEIIGDDAEEEGTTEGSIEIVYACLA